MPSIIFYCFTASCLISFMKNYETLRSALHVSYSKRNLLFETITLAFLYRMYQTHTQRIRILKIFLFFSSVYIIITLTNLTTHFRTSTYQLRTDMNLIELSRWSELINSQEGQTAKIPSWQGDTLKHNISMKLLKANVILTPWLSPLVILVTHGGGL